MGALLADNLVVPLPDLGGNGLADGTESSQVLEVAADVLITSPLQQSQGSGGDVELGDVVLLDNVPVSGEVGVGGRALENDCGDTQKQGGVDDVGVASDPADVTTAEVTVALVDIEDVLAGQGSAKQIAGGGVHDTLWLSGRARSVEEEKGVLRIHGLRGNVAGPLLDLVVPPQITAGDHVNVGAGAAVDEDVADVGALLQGIVDNLLGADELATSLAFVGGDDEPGLGIKDTVPESVGGEAGKDNGVDGADTNTGQDGDDGLGDHGHVDGDGVTLLNAGLLQDPGDLGDVAEKLAVGDVAAIVDLVGLVDEGDAVGVLVSMAVDGVVAGVELALYEPLDVAVSEAAGRDGLKVAVPGQQLAGGAAPELVGLGDGLLVELLVILEVCRLNSACQ